MYVFLKRVNSRRKCKKIISQIYIKRLKPEMTQCRVIQIDKKLKGFN